MFVRAKKSGRYEYLQLVRDLRVDSQVRQEVIATLGRVDALQKGGELDALLSSCARFADKVAVLDAVRDRRHHEVRDPRELAKDPSPLKVKEVWAGGHRYIVRLNEVEARGEEAAGILCRAYQPLVQDALQDDSGQ